MPLKIKLIVFLVVLNIFSYGILNYFTSGIHTNEIRTKEISGVEDEVKLIKRVIEGEFTTLDNIVKDYAYWNDTYEFMTTKDPEYVSGSIANHAFKNLGIDFMVFLDTAGDIFFIKGVRHETADDVEITKEIENSITRLSESYLSLGENTQGFYEIVGKNYLLVSGQILTSELEGPPTGTLIFLKEIDAEYTDRVKDLLKKDFKIVTYKDIKTTLAKSEVAGLLDRGYFVGTVSGKITGYILTNDILDDPGFVIVREIESYDASGGRAFIYTLLFASLIIYLCTIGGTVLFIERGYVTPVNKLLNEIDKIRTKKISTQRINLNFGGEMGVLVKNINTLLESLDNSDKRMVEINRELEVKAREVEENSVELERLNKHMVGREIRMAELKEEIEDLQYKLKTPNETS